METVIIAAGFGPRADGTGGCLDRQAEAVATLYVALHFAGLRKVADIRGTSDGGSWEEEEPGIWIAATLDGGRWTREGRLNMLRENLADWCRSFGQDAVALTVAGQTEFVSG